MTPHRRQFACIAAACVLALSVGAFAQSQPATKAAPPAAAPAAAPVSVSVDFVCFRGVPVLA